MAQIAWNLTELEFWELHENRHLRYFDGWKASVKSEHSSSSVGFFRSYRHRHIITYAYGYRSINQRLSKKITLTNLSGGVVLFEVEISLFQFIDTRFSQVFQQQSVMKNEKFSQTLFRDPKFSFENIFDFYRICNGHIPGTCKLFWYWVIMIIILIKQNLRFPVLLGDFVIFN